MMTYDSAAWTGRPHPPRLIQPHGGISGMSGPICAWGIFSNGMFDIEVYRPLTKHDWSFVPEVLRPQPPLSLINRASIGMRSMARLFMSLMPYVHKGEATWCSKFVIIHAPPALSQMMGRGSGGLQWRWTERGHDIIKADRAEQKRRKGRI